MNHSQYRISAFSLAQVLSITVAVVSVSISAIVGKTLAPNESLSTLPYGLQFTSIIVCSYLISIAMKRFGRTAIFLFGTAVLALSGGIGGLSIIQHSFILNNVAHICLGVTISTYAYFRFAATDGLSDDLKAKAISLVTLGGVVAAFVGPFIAKKTRLLITNNEFAASYFSFSGIAVLMFLLLLIIPPARQKSIKTTMDSIKKVNVKAGINEQKPQKFPLHGLSIAIYASGFGYMLMAMLMMQSSLKMNQMGLPFKDITFVIQLHVIAMFLPSLFMGKVINSLGIGKVLLIGYLTMFISMLIAIFSSGYSGILYALIGIGLGWNILYVGGSSMIASLPGDAHKIQGINESSVALLNTIGAFAAGILFSQIGWINSNWLAMLLLIPGLILLLTGWKQLKQPPKH